MRENRQQPRTKLLKLIKVRTSDDKKLFGHIADISVGGMMVHTHSTCGMGDYLNLLIELPEDVYPKPLDIHAEITWVGRANGHKGRRMGCRFVAIERAERDALLELVKRYPMGEEEL